MSDESGAKSIRRRWADWREKQRLKALNPPDAAAAPGMRYRLKGPSQLQADMAKDGTPSRLMSPDQDE